jgi:hypothetical protein
LKYAFKEHEPFNLPLADSDQFDLGREPGRSFSFKIDPKMLANQPDNTSLTISQADGKPLPDWLRYEADTKTFTAKDIPAGAFPLQLKVGVGGQETTMVIQQQDAQR